MSFDFNNWQNWFRGGNNQNQNQGGRGYSQPNQGGRGYNDPNQNQRGYDEQPRREYQQPNNNQRRTVVEEIQANGQNLVDQVQGIFRESNVRRVRIKRQGRVILDVPVAAAVVGGILAPSLAAIGAIAAVVTNCTIEVTRDETTPTPPRREYKNPNDDASYR